MKPLDPRALCFGSIGLLLAVVVVWALVERWVG